MADLYGYRKGERVIVTALVDASSADIEAGDLVAWNSDGFLQRIAAGDIPCGVAVEDQDNPAVDGQASVAIDISTTALYEYPPDTGTVTQALVGKTMDTGGARSINIDATVDDCVQCVQVDTASNTVLVRLLTAGAFAGV